jgi:hypothetical protein
VIRVHNLHARVKGVAQSSSTTSSSSSSSSSSSIGAADARAPESRDDARQDRPCDVYLDHRYVSPSSSSSSSSSSSAVFIHAATSGHRWQHVLLSMLLLLLPIHNIQHISVVAVGPQAAAACSLSSLAVQDARQSLAHPPPSLSCQPSSAPLHHREIPTLEVPQTLNPKP